jgi:hypothetical protein
VINVSQAVHCYLASHVSIIRYSPVADMSSPSGTSEALRALLDVDAGQAAATAAVLGLVFHHTLLRTVEVELFMYTLVGIGFITLVILFAVHIFAGLTPLAALARVALLSTSFNLAVFLSIGVYRLFFHRLRRFPGPPLAKLSRFYSAYKAAQDLQYYKLINRWNEEYGDFIRTGEYSTKP